MLCHNDPIASNFLFDGKKLQFIDWEYAALGNPLIDLVVVIQNLQLSAQQEQVFLAQYSSLAINAKAVTQAKEAMMYIDWLWWLAKGYDTKDESLVTKLTEIEKKLQLLL